MAQDAHFCRGGDAPERLYIGVSERHSCAKIGNQRRLGLVPDLARSADVGAAAPNQLRCDCLQEGSQPLWYCVVPAAPALLIEERLSAQGHGGNQKPICLGRFLSLENCCLDRL